MIIAVSFSCVVAVAVLGGVSSFPDQQLVSKEQNIGLFQKDHLERNSQWPCGRPMKACKRRGGNCQSNLLVCEGQMLTGNKYCRGSSICGCCVPPRDPSDCDIPCKKKRRPVCGGDSEGNKTYDNFCLLQKAVACYPGSEDVKWLHDGKCECPKGCPYIWDPVCGTDGRSFKTYSNLCLLEAAVACDPKAANMKLQHYGECICQFQSVKGTCKANIPRWYYDVDYGQCRRFIYGGCDGNANRFETYDKCTQTCGHRPYNSTASSWEEDGFLIKDPTRCNDNYGTWKRSFDAKSVPEAISDCNAKKMQLACPQNDYTFITWLQNQTLPEPFWFAGKQGSGQHFNYYYWADNEEIKRYVHDINIWKFTYPTYPITAECVTGKQLLTNEDCTKPLKYYCSPP